MPNIKSAKKRVVVAEIRHGRNMAVKTNLKTFTKKFEAAVRKGDKALSQELLNTVVKKIDQAVAKGVLKKNTAARKKSQLAKSFNSIA